MSDINPRSLREELEIRVVALLSGELLEVNADELEKILSVDEELSNFRDRMAVLIGEVHAARDEVVPPPTSQDLRLSEERRREIFGDVVASVSEPKEKSKKWWHLGLLEIAAMILCGGLLAAILIPSVGKVRGVASIAVDRQSEAFFNFAPMPPEPELESTPVVFASRNERFDFDVEEMEVDEVDKASSVSSSVSYFGIEAEKPQEQIEGARQSVVRAYSVIEPEHSKDRAAELSWHTSSSFESDSLKRVEQSMDAKATDLSVLVASHEHQWGLDRESSESLGDLNEAVGNRGLEKQSVVMGRFAKKDKNESESRWKSKDDSDELLLPAREDFAYVAQVEQSVSRRNVDVDSDARLPELAIDAFVAGSIVVPATASVNPAGMAGERFVATADAEGFGSQYQIKAKSQAPAKELGNNAEAEMTDSYASYWVVSGSGSIDGLGVDAFAAPAQARAPKPRPVMAAPTPAFRMLGYQEGSSNASGPVDPFAGSSSSGAELESSSLLSRGRKQYIDGDSNEVVAPIDAITKVPSSDKAKFLKKNLIRTYADLADQSGQTRAEMLAEVDGRERSELYDVDDLAVLGMGVSTAKAQVQPLTHLSAAERMAEARLKNTSQTPKTEKQTAVAPVSTFSLNVSDVSFKLAEAALATQRIPSADLIRTEEFVNSFNYGDPTPREDEPVTLNWEIAQHPYQHNRQIVRFSLQTQAAGRAANQPLNLNLLVDNSGSMQRPDRRAILQKSLESLQTKLTDQDQLNIILFARQPRLIANASTVVSQKAAIYDALNYQPEGGTNLEAGLHAAYENAQAHYNPAASNRVILMTDGAANLGDVDSSALAQTVIDQRKQGIALDAYGIGWEGYNDALLEEITRNGDGRYAFLNSADSAAAEFAEKLAGTLRVAAADVKVQILWNPKRVTTYRQIGYDLHQLREQDFRDNTVDAAEIGEAESGTALYVLQINDDPNIAGGLGKLQVRYRVPATGEYIERAWPLEMPRKIAALQNAPSSLRLAASSALFAERLANNPYAANYSFEDLNALTVGLSEAFPTQPRVVALQNMIQTAQSLFSSFE
ncbi:MAG: von Willebrand factor type A domain-containing protein [Lentimonas sp.]